MQAEVWEERREGERKQPRGKEGLSTIRTYKGVIKEGNGTRGIGTERQQDENQWEE